MDLNDRLEISVVCATDLPLVTGVPPSTFCEIEVGNDKKRTPVINEERSPVYGSDPLIFYDLVANDIDAVLIYVKHMASDGSEQPLGVVVIPTDTPFNGPNQEIETELELIPTTGVMEDQGRAVVEGKVLIRMIYFNKMEPWLTREQSTGASNGHLQPNQLTVNIIDGTDVGLAQGYKYGVDAVVRVQVADIRQTSKISKTSNHPEWNDTVYLPVDTEKQKEFIEISVYNSGLLQSRFLGRCRVALNQVAVGGTTGLTQKFELFNELYQDDGQNYGVLQLKLIWEYSSELHSAQMKSKNRWAMFKTLGNVAKGGLKGVGYVAGGVVGGVSYMTGIGKKKKGSPSKGDKDETVDDLQDEEDMEKERRSHNIYDEFDVANMSPFQLHAKLDEEREGRKKEIKEILEAAEEEVEIPEGSFNIQIHVLELQQLEIERKRGKGMVSPIVYVECLGRTKHTRPIYQQDSCYLDEVLYFTMDNVKKEQIREAKVRFIVKDHHSLNYGKSKWFDNIIGVYEVDLLSIYTNRDHELHRKWGLLRDPDSKEEDKEGIQFARKTRGLLKYSAVCLGPGDKQKAHDPQKEADDEEDAEEDIDKIEGIGTIDPGARRVPQTQMFLVISIVRIDGLPAYNRLLSKRGLYGFVEAQFAGCQPIKTSKVSSQGDSNLSLVFEEELWMPYWHPSYSKRACITIKNSKFGMREQIIATHYVDYDDVKKYEEDPIKGRGIFSRGEYDGEQLKFIHFYGANPNVQGAKKSEAEFMNKYPNYASSYRGTLLCHMRVVRDSPDGIEASHKMPMNYKLDIKKYPQMDYYHLKAFIFQGSDFGSSGRGSKGGGVFFSTDYCVSVTVGQYEVRSAFKSYADGQVDWLEICEKSNLLLPKQIDNLPDVFITVYKGSPTNMTSVAFLRLKPIEIVNYKTKFPVKWYELQHDQSHKSTPTSGFPGSVLMRIALVNRQDMAFLNNWDKDRKLFKEKTPYVLRARVYQCRYLPATTENGLIDPYVKGRFGGKKDKTKTKRNTQNPVFFETLEFHKEIPSDLKLAPNLLLQVWHNRTLTTDPVCMFVHPIKDVYVSKDPSFQVDLTPQWMPLSGIDGKGNMGEILVSFLLIKKKKVDQNVPPPRTIEPPMRMCWIDLHVIGLRNLMKKGIYKIKQPYLYFDLVSNGYGDSIKTAPSRQPTPENPNFLERCTLKVKIPDDPLYCPMMDIHCYDQRSLNKELLGVATIDLRTMLSWNGAEYIPPRHQKIMSAAAAVREKAKEQGRKEKEEMLRKKVEGGPKFLEGMHGIKKKKQGLRGDREFDSDDEGSEEDEFMLDDEYIGVFPPKAGERERNAYYDELPPIKDAEEEAREMAKRNRAWAKEAAIGDGPSHKGAYQMDEKGEAAYLRELMRFPSSWTTRDYLDGRSEWLQDKQAGGGQEFENKMKFHAFETYELKRGRTNFNKYKKRKSTHRNVGVLKAVIRVTEKNPRYDEDFNQFYKSYRHTEEVVIRVYVIKAQNLLPYDWFGRESSDPYLKVQLGNEERAIKDTAGNSTLSKHNLNPDFFACYEFKGHLAGPSLLKIGVWDKNNFSAHELMGETVIDLEDRWFHEEWQNAGNGGDPNAPYESRLKKPAEVRTLYKPGSDTSQGLVTMFVDILTKDELGIKGFEHPEEMEGPEKRTFQMRIVTWKSKDVMQLLTGKKTADLFVQYTLNNDPGTHYKTDTHWRCKSKYGQGKGSWNWRLLVDVELPLRSREKGTLKVEMMEKNIIDSNQKLGEFNIFLYDFFMLAYTRRQTVWPFQEIKRAKRRRQRQLVKPSDEDGKSVESDDEEEDEDDDDGSFDEGSDVDDGEGGGDLDSDDGFGADDALSTSDNQPLLPTKTKTDKDATIAGETTVGGRKKKGKTVDDGEDSSGDEKESTLKGMSQYVQELLGTNEELDKCSDWYDLTLATGMQSEPRPNGQLAVRIDIVPLDEAEMDPVGKARQEPNKDPYLPQPVGRLSFDFSIMGILNEIFTPWVRTVICLIICCVCCMGFFILLSTQISGFVAIIQLLQGDI